MISTNCIRVNKNRINTRKSYSLEIVLITFLSTIANPLIFALPVKLAVVARGMAILSNRDATDSRNLISHFGAGKQTFSEKKFAEFLFSKKSNFFQKKLAKVV
jgi:hypothetical protein